MSLATELEALKLWLEQLPKVGMASLASPGGAMYVLYWVMIGAVKRSLSLASGLHAMIVAKNMVCARALLRMQLDTVTRVLAYTYVEDPNKVASGVVGGKHLKGFKSHDGQPLTDKYLVDKLSEHHPWVRRVYDFTSGY